MGLLHMVSGLALSVTAYAVPPLPLGELANPKDLTERASKLK